MTLLSELENKLTTVLETIAKLNSKSNRSEEKLNKFESKFDEFESRFNEFEVTFKAKIMDIDKTINQKVTTAVEEVTEKLEQKILVVQSKSEYENNRIDISTPLSKLKTTLEEVTLLSDRIQTLETVLQARANNQIRQEHSTRD